MRTIAVLNQKGGCGKTITAINLSGFLAHEGRRVLLVDMDPQGHATLGLSPDTVEPPATMYDVFVHEPGSPCTRLRDIRRQAFENLDVAPATVLLSAAAEELSGVPGRENILAEALDDVRAEYDYVVVDCPPHVGLLTFNALKACSEVIVPMDPSFFSLHGIGKVMETVGLVGAKTGHQLDARVLVTLYSGRTLFAREVLSEIHRHLEGRHFNPVIRHSIKLAEAASHGLPIAKYCRHCAGYDDYRALSAEVMQLETPMSVGAPAEAASSDAGEPDDVLAPTSPRLTHEGVVFTIAAPDAGRVQLVGDFNDWALEGTEMEPAGRVWKRVLKLQPGRYRYRYIVDGNWLSDPLNAAVEPAPYGGHNSVLVLNEQLVEREASHAV
jgi:chromosome partitioning protein